MKEIIFDLGFNDGSDTKYYLHLGYKVIAVDANPSLINKGCIEFSEYIKNGDLILLNNGISNKNEKLTFYINKNDLWSSFNEEFGKSIIPMYGVEFDYSVDVECITIYDLIKEYGIPYYIKMDIEKYDEIALDSLLNNKNLKPKFISCEYDNRTLFNKLVNIGYTKFKIVNRDIIDEQNKYKNDWYFGNKASGDFGEYLRGEWLTIDEFSDYKYDWVDVHATF